jgi:cyclophilin family peptidyl-prolyl cis-trans isomerase
MIKSFLGKFFRNNIVRRKVRGQSFPVAALESRTLLAGNVTAAIVDGELIITGDDAANDISILETAAGVIVRGNSTTINGGAADFVAFATSVARTGKIVATMGAGNDKVQIDNLTLEGRVVFHGGEGNDSLGLTEATIKAGIGFHGDAGNDSLVMDQSTVEGSVLAFLGAGDDLVTLNGSEIKRSLVLYGRDGADGLNLNDSKVGRWLLGYLGEGDDDVRIANGSETKHVQLWGQRGADVVQVNESDTSRSFAARLGAGDDAVSLEGDVDVGNRLIIRGNGGDDRSARGTGSLPGLRIIRTENSTISGTLVSDRMGLGTGGLQNAVAQANADFVTATFVRIATTEGNIDIELFNEDAPVTVANFLNYLSRYAGTIIHRTADLDPNAAGTQGIMQGGGFRPAAITLDSAIANEFNAANSNVRGTLSMALPGNNINGGTSQWFINSSDDNDFLDDRKHTVFGRVVGNGMTVVDAIIAMTKFNVSGPLDNPALTDVPLKNYTPFSVNLAGTASIATNKTVTGIGTAFNTALSAGEAIQIGAKTYTVASIISATSLTVSETVDAADVVTGATIKSNAAPTDAQYVKINSVTIIDEP